MLPPAAGKPEGGNESLGYMGDGNSRPNASSSPILKVLCKRRRGRRKGTTQAAKSLIDKNHKEECIKKVSLNREDGAIRAIHNIGRNRSIS